MPSKKAETSEPEEYLVEKLVDMKMEGKKKLFLVKWKGFSAKHNTWEPVSNLKDFKDEMAELERSKKEEEEEEAEEEEEEVEEEEVKKEEKPAAKKRAKAEDEKNVAAPPERRAAKESRMAISEGSEARAMPKRGGPSAEEESPSKRAKAAASNEKKPRRPAMDVVALAQQLKAEIQKKRRPGKEPGEEKPPKEKKPRNKKASAEVVEVDKILAVKANVKGGLLYQIQWMDGTKTWEPEDNVMDDDLIDDFEAAEQAKAYSDHEIQVGSEVEVKNVTEGFENSWTAAKVTKKDKGGKWTVEFTGFVDEEGEAETESGVERERLRLVPDEVEKGWVPIVGEMIEVNEDDCWWEARVVEISGKKAKLQLRVSDEFKTSTIGAKKLRPCGWLHMAGKRAKS